MRAAREDALARPKAISDATLINGVRDILADVSRKWG